MRHFFLSIGVLLSLSMPLAAQDIPLSKILVEKEGWREVANVESPTNFLMAQADGSVKIYKDKLIATLDAAGKINLKTSNADFASYRSAAAATINRFYFIDKKKQILFEVGDKFRALELKGLTDPACIKLWPDEGHLVIGESDGTYLWAVRIEKDGSLGRGDRYYSLRTKPNEKMHVTAMTMDASYLLYVCTPLGIQVFDPTGRLSGVIAAPSKATMTAITIGGEKADTLFVAAGDKIYARKIQGRAPYTLKKEK